MPARRHSRNRRARNLARNVVATVRENYWLFTTVALLLVITVVAYWNVAGPGFKACAVPDKVADAANYQKTISALDGVVDLSIKLSTALAGFGAAALIGLKSGIKLSPAVGCLFWSPPSVLCNRLCMLCGGVWELRSYGLTTVLALLPSRGLH
jgi:hypothetical protein